MGTKDAADVISCCCLFDQEKYLHDPMTQNMMKSKSGREFRI